MNNMKSISTILFSIIITGCATDELITPHGFQASSEVRASLQKPQTITITTECDPPFIIDNDGTKLYKRNCLGDNLYVETWGNDQIRSLLADWEETRKQQLGK